MEKRILYLIDTDQDYFTRLKKRFEIIKLDQDFEIKPYYPDTTLPDQVVENVINETTKEINDLKVVAIFVDMVIVEDGTRVDPSGVIIALRLKSLFQHIPVYLITGKFVNDEYIDVFSSATMEHIDGVFSKNFLSGKMFDLFRLQKILKGKTSLSGTDNNQIKPEIIKYDVAITTALYEDEFENVIKIFNLQKLNYTENFYQGTLDVGGNNKINIIATHQYESGMVEAAVFTTFILNRFNPKYLIMTGVCGGKNDSKINFGDIVFATKLYTFHKGKLNPTDFAYESEICKIDDQTIVRVRTARKTIARGIMDSDPTRSSHYESNPLKIHIEPMCCSDFVINDDGFFKLISKLKDRKTIAVDMESYAVARSCEIINNGFTKAYIIKSVMDKMKKKNDDYKSYAAYTSVEFLKNFLTRILFPHTP